MWCQLILAFCWVCLVSVPGVSLAQQPAEAPAVVPVPTASPAEDDRQPPTPANPTVAPSSDDDLLAPAPAGTTAAPSSDDDLLLPQSGDTNAPMPDDLLLVPNAPNPPPVRSATVSTGNAAADHAQLLVESKFPSASTCATCHPTQFRQWSVSQHAYAQLSPIFNAFQATVDKMTAGTNGDFCIRCHTQVGMQIKEPVLISNMDRNPTSREGITCISCHRVKNNYGKVSGRIAIQQGDLFEPVFGPRGPANLKKVLSQPDKFQVVTKRGEIGRAIHTNVIKFDPLEKSGFCGDCHDVNLLNGFRLEEAFTQFKNSPANKRGETCQDCHMGKIPGVKSGYAFGPAAMIGDQPTPSRKLTNHSFAGPDYSVIHPGLFPFNVKAQELATMREWLQFDYKAGWGTDAFENKVAADYKFPPRWQAIDDRYDARAILDDQFAKLEEINHQRYQILRRGFQLHQLVVEQNDARGIKFKVKVANGTDGHGAPTGFDLDRTYFLQATVTDRRGKVIFASGDRDPNGDIRYSESSYVHNRKLPFDKYLFTLQSKSIVTLLRGGENVQVIPVNQSIDPLPFVRPSTNADFLVGRPGGARKHATVLPPGGSRWANYKVEASQLTGQAPYKVNLKFITQMVPVNLLREVNAVGFDYNMSPKSLAVNLVERSQTLWNKTIVLPTQPTAFNLKPTIGEILAPPGKPFQPESKGAKAKPVAVADAQPASSQ